MDVDSVNIYLSDINFDAFVELKELITKNDTDAVHFVEAVMSEPESSGEKTNRFPFCPEKKWRLITLVSTCFPKYQRLKHGTRKKVVRGLINTIILCNIETESF